MLTSQPRRYLERLKNYGALFLGPETNVSYGACAATAAKTPPSSASVTRALRTQLAGTVCQPVLHWATYG